MRVTPPADPPEDTPPAKAVGRGVSLRAPWKPGSSGNAKGINQHTGVPSFRQLMEEELNRPVPIDDRVPKRETNKAALVRMAVTQARKGNLTALMWLVERVEGKVPDHVVQDVRNAVVMVPWNDEEADVTYVPRATADHVLPAPGETLPPYRDGRPRSVAPDEALRETFAQEQDAEGSQGHTSEG